jgi:hypothetical protein
MFYLIYPPSQCLYQASVSAVFNRHHVCIFQCPCFQLAKREYAIFWAE